MLSQGASLRCSSIVLRGPTEAELALHLRRDDQLVSASRMIHVVASEWISKNADDLWERLFA